MQYDVVVIGGGIVGIATALKSLEQNPKLRIAILEKENSIGKHQTGNNSGVIHSGIYYKPGGLRAENNKRGYRMLLDFCDQHSIPYEICGKIIVATEEKQLNNLKMVFERGNGNGLQGIKMISSAEMREHEPHVAGLQAIWVPQAGIVDYSLVLEKYADLIRQKGGEIYCNEKVIRIQRSKDRIEIVTENKTYESRLLVNCAGLYSDRMAKMSGRQLNMQILPFRGEYYKLKKEKEYLVKNLIYPAPDPDFPWLGVHFTRMAWGGVEAGPNAVLAWKREGYKKTDIDIAELFEAVTYKGFMKMASRFWKQGMDEYYRSFSKSAFTAALQKLIPELKKEDLEEGGAGVRALALNDDGQLLDDYVFFDDKQVINVCNAPSPAATSSLSIGQTISEMVVKNLN